MFILSKIIGFILDPFMWILALLAIAYFSRRKWLKRKLYTSAVIIFLVFSNPFLVNNLWYRYQSGPTELAEGVTYDMVILLGGLAGLDERVNKGIFTQSADRFIQTARLYETGRVKRILITGGDSRIFQKIEFKEANFLASNLIDLHIPAKDIFIESDARNTKENAKFSKRILDSLGAKGPHLLVTSAQHMPRALMAFRNEGIEVIPYACNFTISGTNTLFQVDNFIPNLYSLSNWKSLLREYMGYAQIKLSGYFSKRKS